MLIERILEDYKVKEVIETALMIYTSNHQDGVEKIIREIKLEKRSIEDYGFSYNTYKEKDDLEHILITELRRHLYE